MLASIRSDRGTAKIQVHRRRLTLGEIDHLHRDVSALFRRGDLDVVILSLREVDFVDNSLVNLLRALASEARSRRVRFSLRDAPPPLRYALTAPSFRMSWASGLVPLDSSSPISVALGRVGRR